MRDLTVFEALREMYIVIAALVFNIVLLILFREQTEGKKLVNIYFRKVTVVILCANVLSMLAFFLMNVKLDIPVALALLSQLASYVLNIYVAYYFCVYVESLTNQDPAARSRQHTLNRAVMVFMTLVIIGFYVWSLPKLHIPGRFPYATGAFRLFAGFAAEFYFLGYALTLLIGKTGISVRNKRMLPWAFIVTVSTLVLQGVMGTRPLLNYLGPTIGLLIFYFTAETSDYINLIRTTQALDEETQRTKLLESFSKRVTTQCRALIGMNDMIIRDAGDDKIQMYARSIERTIRGLLELAAELPKRMDDALLAQKEQEENTKTETRVKTGQSEKKHVPLLERIIRIGRYGATKEEYESCRSQMLQWNEKSGRIILTVAFFGFIVAYAATGVMSVMQEFRPTFIVFFLITGAFYLPVVIAKQRVRKYATLIAYAGIVIVLSFAIATGSLHADERAIDYPVMMVWLCLCIVDNTYRLAGVVALMDLACFYMLHIVKAPEIAQRDTYNILIYSILMIAGHFLLQRNRFNEMLDAGRYEATQTELLSTMEQLREATDSATRASRSKSDFLANMSHEIRTPINAVLGMNEMILRDSTDERIKLYAHNVDNAGKNLLSIINDILDFSKIEAGRMEIAEAKYHLSEVLNDVSNMILFKAKSKDLKFDVNVDETLPDLLYGDEVRVRQVITNILNNAVKYTNEGSVTLSVSGERSAEKRIELIVSVSDTGIGIREEDRRKLFTKFERVDLEQTNTIEGTGLGLAITENLLELMHGSIYVESTYGEGSTFTMRIPQGIAEEGMIGDFRKRTESSYREKQLYRETFRAPDAHILVVDDTQMNLAVIEGLLKQTQVRIDTADGGEAALRLTKETTYDLILLDQRMPKMNGTQTLEGIRAQTNGCNAGTMVICLTADAVQGARERYLEEGFTDYLSKPVESVALETMLMKYLPADKVTRIQTADATGSTQDMRFDHEDTPEMKTRDKADVKQEQEQKKTMTSEEAKEYEREMTPKLLSAMSELKKALEPYFKQEETDEEALPEIAQEELDELYEGVLEFAEMFDQDGIMRLLSQTEEYAIPEGERERFAHVKKCAQNSDWNGLRDVLGGA